MHELLVELAIVVLGSNGLFALILKHIWKKHDQKDKMCAEFADFKEALNKQSECIADMQRFNVVEAKEQNAIKETLRLLSYDMLCNRLLYHIDKGYATRAERDAVSLYIKTYKQNGWNGDINAVLDKFNALPFEEEDNK